ncbi:MAG: hypothetical protein CO080_06260 [Nitrospirae bacterium CG_4_9_14_0_8_um_filter_70_14]|nr:MAG: hypothetical protein CO080_06260 [Nitrospirae bacterium CG_4_9_14_0_8_um_filter_70_14]
MLSGVLSVWLVGQFLTQFLIRKYGFEWIRLIAAMGVALLWPVGYFVLSGIHFFPRRPTTVCLFGVLGFITFAATSSVVSPNSGMSFLYVMLTGVSFFVAMQFSSALREREWQRGFAFYSVLGVAVLLMFTAFDYRPGTRLGNGTGILNPNSVGFVAVSVTVCSLMVRTRVVAICTFCCGMGVIFLTGSRSAFLGALIALFIATFFLRKNLGKKSLIGTLIGVFIMAALCAIYWSEIWPHITSFLALDSSYRGIGSGATGRVIAWAATWDLFKAHPWFGVGYRAHGELLKMASSGHNGYLATLAEVGILGFLSAMVIVFSGLAGLWRRAAAGERSSAVLLALCCGYLIIAMFERFLFNQGNPSSLLFMLGVFWGARRSGAASQCQDLGA